MIAFAAISGGFDWERYQQRGVLLFARYDGPRYTLVAVSTSDADETVPFWFPLAGDYHEELHGGDLDLKNVAALQQTALTVPSTTAGSGRGPRLDAAAGTANCAP